MKVASKVAVGSGSLLLIFAGTMLHQLTVVHGLVRAHRDLSTSKIRAAKIALEELRLLEEMEDSARKLEVTADVQYGAKIERLQHRYGEGLEELGALDLGGDEKTALARLKAAWQGLPALPPKSGEADSYLAPLGRLRGETESFLGAVERAIEREARDSAAAGEVAGRIALWVFVLALALCLLVVRLTVRSIREPLRRLIAGTRAVAEERFDLELDTSRDDEFSRLAADFNAMVRRLGELDAVKKDLLSHVSHELKTPLATLQETQQILLEEIPGPLNAQQRRLLELNLKSSERLSRLISKLLDLSRLEAGVTAYDFTCRTIGPLVADVAEELAPRARERRVRIETRMPEEPLELACDGDRLIQVLENLLENAIKFAPEQSVIELRVRAAATPPESAPPGCLPASVFSRDRGFAVLVTVSDSGSGVPDAEKSRIFEKFHQAGPRRGGSVGGAGLGLAICRSIVEVHQGALWVTDRPEKGSTFWLLLPGGCP